MIFFCFFRGTILTCMHNCSTFRNAPIILNWRGDWHVNLKRLFFIMKRFATRNRSLELPEVSLMRGDRGYTSRELSTAYGHKCGETTKFYFQGCEIACLSVFRSSMFEWWYMCYRSSELDWLSLQVISISQESLYALEVKTAHSDVLPQQL